MMWALPYAVRQTCLISEQCGGNSAGKVTAFISLTDMVELQAQNVKC